MSWLSDDSLGVFVVLTLILGGGAAFLAGRALARGWKPFWRLFFYMALLAAAVRFFHYALFDGTLLSLHYFVVDSLVCLIAGLLGFRAERARQMATQYRWINVRSGFLYWRRSQP